MSSISYCRVRTLDKAALEEAAKGLKMELTQLKDGTIQAGKGLQFKFDSKGECQVIHASDFQGTERRAEQLTKLGSYFSMRNRFTKQGFNVTKSTKDPVLAVESNQDLVLEFEEQKVAVKA